MLTGYICREFGEENVPQVENGFIRYSFEPKGLSIAPKTLAKCLDRMTQLYEQGADYRRIGKRKGKR